VVSYAHRVQEQLRSHGPDADESVWCTEVAAEGRRNYAVAFTPRNERRREEARKTQTKFSLHFVFMLGPSASERVSRFQQ